MSPKKFYQTILFLLLMSLSCQSARPPEEKVSPPEKTWHQWCKAPEGLQVFYSESDRLLATRAMDEVAAGLPEAPISELIIALAGKFMSTPYMAHTLEEDAPERLVVNLSAMDCTTFVEQMLAMALAVKQGNGSFEDFTRILACIRYRDGIIDGYPSRLHYFTDWLQNNSSRGIIEIVSNELSSQAFDSRVYFMTANPGAYRQLENPAFVQKMKVVEKNISAYEMNFIPKEKIKELEDKIINGDIIAFSTDIAGLDVSHTGFAFFREGRLHLLHASQRTGKVEVTAVALHDYLAPLRRVTGILVGRVR